MNITEITPINKKKAKVSFDDAESLILYISEIRKLGICEQQEISTDTYKQIYYEIVGKRAQKRAMHLLEKMDRTEAQLRKKLEEGAYPQELIDAAVRYVKSYRYIDDERYACMFIRQNQQRRSTARLRQDLLNRGIDRAIIERALEQEQETPQEELIIKLLAKKNYNKDTASPQDTRRIYQFLLRRGFKGEEIMRVLI